MPTDIVMPIKHEDEFYQIALRMGYDTLVMAYMKKPEQIPKAPSSLKIYLASIDKKSQWADIVIARAKIDSRQLLEERGIDCVYGLETTSPKDFMHQRASGLNNVLTDIAARKKKTIIFDFSSILNARPMDRSIVMGRMSQNIRLLRKSKATTAIASMATTPYMMRSPHDLASLFCGLGMHQSEARDATNMAGDICEKNQEEKEGTRLGESIRVIKK